MTINVHVVFQCLPNVGGMIESVSPSLGRVAWLGVEGDDVKTLPSLPPSLTLCVWGEEGGREVGWEVGWGVVARVGP